MGQLTVQPHPPAQGPASTIPATVGGSLWQRVTAERAPWLLGLLALVVYLPGVGWGLPHATGPGGIHGWDVDSVVGMLTLTEFHNLLVVAKPDWYVAYPLFHYLVLGLVYAPYLGYLMLSGDLTISAASYPFGMRDPVSTIATLALLGHLVTVAMACGVIVLTYLSARTVWGRSTAIVASLLMLLMTPMFYYSRTGNLDVPVLFWMTLGLWAAAQILARGPTPRRGVVLGVAVALAVATKDQAYGAWLPALAVLMVIHFRVSRGTSQPFTYRLWPTLLATAVAGLVTYVVASGLLVRPGRFVAHLRFVRDFEQTFYNVARLGDARPPTLEGYTRLLRDVAEAGVEAMGPVVLIAALAGLVLTWRSDLFTWLLAALLVGHVCLVVLPVRHMQYRYILLVTLVVALLAARGFVLGWQGGRVTRSLAVVGLALGVSWLAVRGLDLTYQMLTDTRWAAADWLARQACPGDQIGYFGAVEQLPPLPPSVEPRALPDDDSALQVLAEERIRFVLVSPDWSSAAGMDHSRFLSASVYSRLIDGSAGYQRLEQFSPKSLLGYPLKFLAFVSPPISIYSDGPGTGEATPRCEAAAGGGAVTAASTTAGTAR